MSLSVMINKMVAQRKALVAMKNLLAIERSMERAADKQLEHDAEQELEGDHDGGSAELQQRQRRGSHEGRLTQLRDSETRHKSDDCGSSETPCSPTTSSSSCALSTVSRTTNKHRSTVRQSKRHGGTASTNRKRSKSLEHERHAERAGGFGDPPWILPVQANALSRPLAVVKFTQLQRLALKVTWRKMTRDYKESRATNSLMCDVFRDLFASTETIRKMFARRLMLGAFNENLQRGSRGSGGGDGGSPQNYVPPAKSRQSSERFHGSVLFSSVDDFVQSLRSDQSEFAMPCAVHYARVHQCLWTSGLSGSAFESLGLRLVDAFLQREAVQSCPEAKRAWMKFFAYLVDLLRSEYEKAVQVEQRRAAMGAEQPTYLVHRVASEPTCPRSRSTRYLSDQHRSLRSVPKSATTQPLIGHSANYSAGSKSDKALGLQR